MTTPSTMTAGTVGRVLPMLLFAAVFAVGASGICPHEDPELQLWSPEHSEENHVTIEGGRKFLLTSSVTVHSINITSGGKLVIKPSNNPIVLRTRYILIENGAELHIGSEDCPYQGHLTIILYGRSDDGEIPHDYFGHKCIGLGNGGTLEIHGEKKMSWTFLGKTLHPGGMSEGGYFFQKSWGHRGIIVHTIDPKTGDVTHADRFDTYKSKDESTRMANYIKSVPEGTILSVAVNDEGSRHLDDAAKKVMTKLGSRHFLHLGFRHPWSFITVKGDPSSSVEDHVEYKGSRGSAVTRVHKLFQAENGEHFNVSLSSEWAQDVAWTQWFDKYESTRARDWEKLSEFHAAHPGKLCTHPINIQVTTLDGTDIPTQVFYKGGRDYRFECRQNNQVHAQCPDYKVRFLCGKPVKPRLTMTVDTNVNSTILHLADNARSWKAGDIIVVTSTDYSMYQAEEFKVLPCRACTPNQVKVEGQAKYLHIGEEMDGVDMRAEVGLLSRNVVIFGEMEENCYNHIVCKFFDFDTFGGHIKISQGFKAVHLEGIELKHMGQQSMGHYPIHFHTAGDVDEKGGYYPPTYVKDISIHHAFSRCVTVHGTNGLLVKDIVGYDTLGHCFFTEDGPEERNTFDHCLGLLVKAGTLLPSDRDNKMCKTISEGSYPGYIAKPRQDCNAVSTFWIANPNNNLINCSAAGSEETGFWFIFHHVPTGPSEGLYAPGKSELTPLGKFHNNRAHSNYRAGMIIDNGVKTTEASDKDKRPILTLVGARYGPHQDADPFKPRVPAIIQHFIAYKNQDHGAWLRGGDVWLDDCQFSDNGIGLTLASGGTFPDDDGSKQEVKNSIFVGESNNVGTEMEDNNVWGPGGLDHNGRTLPKGVNFPVRGIQIYDGPVNVENCTFRNYISLDGRHTSAIGFRLNNSWQSCPNNNVTKITFEQVPIASRVFFGEPGPWFSQMEMDGDKTTVFHDIDGSVSEYPGAFLVKEDNWLLRHPDCLDVPDWKGAICSGNYAQIYVQARRPADASMIIFKDEYPEHPLHLEGALGKGHHYQQYQPVITLQKGYTVHWDKTAPEELTLWLINFQKNDWIQVGFCYPKGTTFSILSDIHNRLAKQTFKTGTFVRTFQMDKVHQAYPGRGYYYWDEESGLLFLMLKAQNEKDKFAFCSVKGCERIKIKADIPKGSGVSNCQASAYPKYSQIPIVDVPLPKKLNGNDVEKTKDHLLEIKVESYNTRYYHLKDDFAYIEVDNKKFFMPDDGIQVVVIDGSQGKIVDSASFKTSILQGIPAQFDNYVTNIKDNSIVVIVSKGRLYYKGPWIKVLGKLGADAGLKLKDKLAFVGYKGNFQPIWTKLVTNSEAAKIYQVVPFPVERKMKL
ncbi:cell migration-inducing and hyaluronan-binding protein isoform 1-T2 [Anomaloglossus baeobatrachus]|uniref:cell migration-inducing and hyaluronan-binding protein isoform X1 n=1 Tax=Anomaloglossus baeobatrachus TaxID=238106 RepID=UPI003F4FD4EA